MEHWNRILEWVDYTKNLLRISDMDYQQEYQEGEKNVQEYQEGEKNVTLPWDIEDQILSLVNYEEIPESFCPSSFSNT